MRSIVLHRSSRIAISGLVLFAMIAVAALAVAAAGTGAWSFTSPDYEDVFCGNPIPAALDPVIQPPVTAPGMASTVSVNIVKFSFDPPNPTIYVGDTVTWTNIDGGGHTSTSNNSLWNSGTLQNGQSFSFTFTSAGTFAYHCTIHTPMMGSITVLGAGPTPTPTSSNTPTLGNYPSTSIPLSADTTVIPDAAPTLSVRMTISTSTGFKGKLVGDPVTGTVRVTNPHPAGTYGVRVTSYESGGASATKAFSMTVTTPAACNPVTFASAVNFGVGNGPRSATVGDFNGDGKHDLAVANQSTNNVSILLGNGAGSFGTAANFAAGSVPYSVAVGDFNGDGKQDLVVANEASNNVSILLGNGAGSFSSATNFNAGVNPTAAVVGEFNGDGKQDLAVSHLGSTSVSVLLGNGAGSFGAFTNFNIGTTSFSVAVGDFNSDGKHDLVTANLTTGNLSMLLGNGTGGFAPAVNLAVGQEPASVTVGDFNEDGKQDIAAANSSSNNVSILLANETGGFNTAANFAAGSGTFSLAVGDFNSDGHQDLVTSNYSSFNLSILLGNGTGSFSSAANLSTVSQVFSVVVGDFNGDGRQDLAAANFSSNNVSIFLRNCAATPTPTNTPTATPTNTPTNTPTPTPTNTPTAFPTPFPEYDLTISQTDSPDPVISGQPLTYTLTVTNSPSVLGGGACPNVRFDNPTGVPIIFNNATGTNGYNASYDPNGVTFSGGCLNSMSGVATATLTVVLTPQSTGTLTSLGSNVVVDPENNWNEDNENNNTAATITTTVNAPTPTPTNTPTNTPSDTPTASPTDTPTATPTATPEMSSISGTVTYPNASAPPKFISNVTITGAGSPPVSTLTELPGATAGQYTLTGFGAGSYTVTPTKPTGGVNGITSFDAARVAQHVTAVPPLLNSTQLIAADASNNGSVSSFDAGQIAKFAISSPPFGLTGTWRFFTPGPTFPVGSSPTNRTYPTVSGQISGQDYVGILVGEVSGNWNPNAAPIRPVNNGGPERFITVNALNLVTSADKEIIVPVTVNGVADKEIISYEFALRYDPTVIQPQANPVDLAGTISSRLSFVVNAEEPGLLRVAVYGPMPIDANGILLNLRFIAVGVPGSMSPLTWEKMIFNEGDPQVNAANGQVELSSIEN